MILPRVTEELRGACTLAPAQGARRDHRVRRPSSAILCSSRCPYPATPQIGRDLRSPLAGRIVFDTGQVPIRSATVRWRRKRAQGTRGVGRVPATGTRLVRAFNAINYNDQERSAPQGRACGGIRSPATMREHFAMDGSVSSRTRIRPSQSSDRCSRASVRRRDEGAEASSRHRDCERGSGSYPDPGKFGTSRRFPRTAVCRWRGDRRCSTCASLAVCRSHFCCSPRAPSAHLTAQGQVRPGADGLPVTAGHRHERAAQRSVRSRYVAQPGRGAESTRLRADQGSAPRYHAQDHRSSAGAEVQRVDFW